MRVAVIGSHGMLGKAVVTELIEQGHEVGYCPRCNIMDFDRMAKGIGECDAIINCAGVIPGKDNSPYRMIEANALGPHVLARYRKPMINVSTDCVFRGDRRPMRLSYKYTDVPDAVDDYGRTKALGEVHTSYILNLRTSFIGFDHGLLAWLLDSRNKESVQGWSNAMWSGSSVKAVAREIVRQVLPDAAQHGGTYHLATREPISKYQLLEHLVERLGLQVKVIPTEFPYVNRVLEPDYTLPQIEGVPL
jgi:dTDP-4-dehydrorhamnose reductase